MIRIIFNGGWQLIVHALRILRKYPIFIVPIIIVWLIYAPIVIYLKYFFPWDNFNIGTNLIIIFLVIFIFSFIILISCTIILEFIQQLEAGKKLCLISAFQETIKKDAYKVLLLAIIWAIIWFILTIIEVLLSEEKREKEEFNAENVAKILADYRKFSLSRAFIQALQKGIRMTLFLILPAIAWEDLDFLNAIKKGLRVLRAYLAEFARGYTLTYFAAGIVFLPPAIIFALGTSHNGHPPLIHFSESIWVGVIIYIGFAWSFCMYLEQMFTANLYLWHLKWERRIKVAKSQEKPLPKFKDIEPPLLLGNIPELSQHYFLRR